MIQFVIFKLALLVLLCFFDQGASEVYYITTTSADLCTVQPCLTLSQFAANLSHCLHSNTTLVFLPGTHYLSTANLTFSTKDYVALRPEFKNSTAQIKCTNNSHSIIYFSQSQYVHIANLEFIGCGGNQVKQVEKFVIQDTNFKGQDGSGTALELIGTTAQIVNSTFVSYGKGSYRKCAFFFPEEFEDCYGDGFIGGAIIATNSTIDIIQSKFECNRAEIGGAVLAEEQSIVSMSGVVFFNNSATWNGGVLYSNSSTITIEASEFQNNSAIDGGVLYTYWSNVKIEISGFHNNSAYNGGVGGVLSSFCSTVTMKENLFQNNNAVGYGGVLISFDSIIIIQASRFQDNSATHSGGALMLPTNNTVTIEASEFQNNTATTGGVLESSQGTIAIEASVFHDNSATRWGGVLSSFNSRATIANTKFVKNGSPIGAVIYAKHGSKVQYRNHVLIDNNTADGYAVIYLSDSDFSGYVSENAITFSNNLGSLLALNSNVTFIGYTIFVNSHSTPTITDEYDFQEGGAITVFQSNIYFDGTCYLEHNHAENGGAIQSIESKLYLNDNVTISHNTATGNGGGVYLSTSELNCQQRSTFILFNNTALHKGGGLHAISSTIKATSALLWLRYIGTRINFIKNAAKMGGGLSLEANAKLYILKYGGIPVDHHNFVLDTNTTVFTANSANYGGAVYVDDNTNSGTYCAPRTECFFQVLAIYDGYQLEYLKIQSMYFSQNYADISGSTLFGGLLDRCSASQFAEFSKKYAYDVKSDGIAYFNNCSIPTYYNGPANESYEADKEASVTTNISISSQPVRVCLCINHKHGIDCTQQSQVEVKKGQTFTVSLVAVDQVGQPVSAIIQTTLMFAGSGLAEGQLARKITAECTDLTFNVASPHDYEDLTLYAIDGPCKDADLSTTTVEIHFLHCTCPIGLQVSGISNTSCTCEYHNNISQYVVEYDSHTGSLVKQPESRAWISYINDTDLPSYLVYPNCPFDYCLSISPPVNLNQPNGADSQCAFNRSSLLCGSCQPGLSLSLGSSHCLSCPSYWPALLIAITIAAILAGIGLVGSLLVLNMTVGVGTLNGLIFYANIVHVNKSIFLPFKETNFITVFLSWLNLELGIDTCYIPGMDTYIKTWLQLSFPAYIILLVVLVIIISSYSTRFSNFIGKKNPVATLATLILLSYAKLLEICFKSLSVGILEYPDGSSEMLWLPDATINYLTNQHIPLFITAVLILLVGLVFTALLFSWQWLLYLPGWRIFRWSRNPKIQTFIETYHTPYTPKHRYWTGLLLIVRIILYLVAAINVSNDPIVALTAITSIVCCIHVLRLLIGSRLYRKWPLDVLETIFSLNILFLAIITWYSVDNLGSNHLEPAANTSVIITFVTLLLVILYHVYTYTPVCLIVKKTKLGGIIDQLSTDADPKPECHCSPPPDDDIHQFNELLDVIDRPVNTNDYNVQLKQKPVKPTQSVVEVHHQVILHHQIPENQPAHKNK